MTKFGEATLEKNFNIILTAALNGERCPQSKPFGPIDPPSPSILARAGRIKIEIFMHNYRVITIMEGEHKGKHTAMPPKGHGTGRPYRMVYKDHILKRQRV